MDASENLLLGGCMQPITSNNYLIIIVVPQFWNDKQNGRQSSEFTGVGWQCPSK
jgi:hypothetical protein